MAINIRATETNKSAEEFINDMADKQYGVTERTERFTISLEGKLYDKIDEIVRKRKRTKQPNRTVSAFIREALERYIAQLKI